MNWRSRLFSRGQFHNDLSAEMRAHLDEKIDALVASGMSRAEAERTARREFGNVTLLEERSREIWQWPSLESFFADVRFAFRMLRKSHAFTATALLSLVLGTGATTAIFSLVYGVVFHPFPYKNTDRIVYVEVLESNGRYSELPLVNGDQLGDIRKLPSVEDVLLQTAPRPMNLNTQNSPVTVNAAFYSPNIFAFLGAAPLLGRMFAPTDVPTGKPEAVAVLSYQFWREQFAGNREVIGKTIELDRAAYTVIGVAPPRFTWFDTDVYLPGTPTADPHNYWMAFPKLKPKENLRAVEGQFQALVHRFAEEDPTDYSKSGRVKLVTLNDEVLGDTGGVIADLFAAAVFLLLIGCANVSILLLARGTARQHEFAVRTSVGAARLRLIRQLLVESVLLSMVGATFGVLAAYWAVSTIRGLLPYDLLPHEVAIQLNAPVLLFSIIVAAFAGIVFGILPALELSRPQLSSWLHSSGTTFTGNVRLRRMQRLPIAGQVALTLLLLAGAGGATKALLARLRMPQGFDPRHVFCMRINLPTVAANTKQERIEELISEQDLVRRAVAHTPGVVDAGFSPPFRFPKIGFDSKVQIEGKPNLTNAQAVVAPISPQLLSVLHVPLLRGRAFTSVEEERQARVAMVNQAFVRDYLGGLDPVGQRVRVLFLQMLNDALLSATGPDDWIEVIGVVGDATNDDFDHPGVRPAVFLPFTYLPGAGRLYVRASGDAQAEIRSVETRVREVNPGIVVLDAYTLQWALNNWGWGRERLVAVILALYAGIALALAATGLYGVVSFAVTQRTQELGIRIALGAGRGAILQLVLRSTVAMLATGIVAGLIISTILGPLVSAWGGGKLTDPAILLAAALILMLVAATACIIPARRAMKVDPMVALRYE